jgi:hypothetical protein
MAEERAGETPAVRGGMLLTREEFRRQVFARDGGRCIICGAPGVDAHHIVEQRLFDDGGYYLDNGATLCADCHVRAEMTVLPCDTIRAAIAAHGGSGRVVLPPHLYPDQAYDKWGNPILPNGQRLRGELYDDGSVQKILAAGGVLPLFTSHVRYPRTYHLPWSPGATDDDRVLPDVRHFEGQEVVVHGQDGRRTDDAVYGLPARPVARSGLGLEPPPGPQLGGEPAQPGGLEDPAGLARLRRKSLRAPFDPLSPPAGVVPGLLGLERAECLPALGGHGRLGGAARPADGAGPLRRAVGRGTHPGALPADLVSFAGR